MEKMIHQIRQSRPKTISHNRIKDTSRLFKKQNEYTTIIIEKLASKFDLNETEKIRKYAKGRFLGKGGFAKCYELICQDNNKIFAAKMLPISDIKNERQRQKLITEIKIHKSLHHQQIVAFEHNFKDSSNVYILLELCQNQTLNELFERRKKLSEIEVQCYMIQLIKGLQYLHSHRIIHRDLKLGNLFLNDRMELKIGDFGLATKLDFEGERKKTVCGTPNYIAPEVLNGSGHSYEVDIWALGVIIYTLLIGKPPFETKEVKTTYNKIKKADFSFPTSCNISSAAKKIIKRILTLEPKKRPSLNDILSDDFFNQGIAIPKLLPMSTLALTLPKEYIKHFNPDFENKEIINKEKMSSKNVGIKRSNSGDIIQYKEVNDEIKDIDKTYLASTKNLVPDLRKDKLILKKEIWVTKWVDYSNKFGIGYLLNNGYIGVYFNDTTKIILNPIKNKFTYIDKKVVDFQELLYTFSINEYPNEIKNKVYLFKKFKNYLDEENNKIKLNENISLNGKKINEENETRFQEKHRRRQRKKKDENKLDEDEQNVTASMKNAEDIDFIFIKKWIKTKFAIIFRFSNKAIQACFKDKTEIYIHYINENISYINKKGEKLIYPLNNAFNCSNYELKKRIKYIKQVLQYMINSKNKNQKNIIKS